MNGLKGLPIISVCVRHLEASLCALVQFGQSSKPALQLYLLGIKTIQMVALLSTHTPPCPHTLPPLFVAVQVRLPAGGRYSRRFRRSDPLQVRLHGLVAPLVLVVLPQLLRALLLLLRIIFV